jgi:hypothetical protein
MNVSIAERKAAFVKQNTKAGLKRLFLLSWFNPLQPPQNEFSPWSIPYSTINKNA